MTDAHCHVARGETRHFLCEPFDGDIGPHDAAFAGFHPWLFLRDSPEPAAWRERLRQRLAARPQLGVGEIGLDRLKEREIPEPMLAAFRDQLALAAEFARPVVLHGAKCWGRVVRECAGYAARIPAFLFHGFSRSGGLLPEIVRLNGYVSVGPAVLNDHAVNYRELVRQIPPDRLLVESDSTAANAADQPSVSAVAHGLAKTLGTSLPDLLRQLEENADAFLSAIVPPPPPDLHLHLFSPPHCSR